MKTVQELVSHIKKHDDAVIIIGPGINPIQSKYTSEQFNSEYTMKELKRNIKKTFKFFEEYIYGEINNSEAYDLIDKINHSLILDQNINGSLAAFYLHGHIDIFKCQKCKTIFPIEGIKDSNDNFIITCECCGGKIRPSVLVSGERYDQIIFDQFKKALLDTHTLILVGMDYTEESLLNLIADYGDMKSQLNAEGNPENERVLIAVQSDSETFDPNEITFCEFLVKGDITKSLERLSELL